jgi:dihydroorotase (multifunctional complex type)
MKKSDLLIKNGTLVSTLGKFEGDVLIKNGKIAAIVSKEEKLEAESVLDARGKFVLPGMWHAHCHFREPGLTNKEDFESGTKCAAAGGITFVIDQTNNEPAPTTVERFMDKKSLVERKSLVDFGLYGGGLIPEEIAGLASAGAIGIKVFNTRHPKEAYPYIPTLAVTDHGLLYEIFEETAKVGLVCSVHHDDSDWVRRMVFRDYIDKGKTDIKAYIEAFEKGYMYGHGMVSGLASSLYLAKLAGVRLYVLHVGVMPDEAYDLIDYAKKRGQRVYAELEACSFLISKEMANRIGPRTYLFARNAEKAWESMRSGLSDVLVLEHAPHTGEEIEAGWTDNFSTPLGVIGIQEFLPLMLNEVNKGKLTLEELVMLASENPSKIFGVYPRKGIMAVGSDADFTIVDLDREFTLSSERSFSKSGWTAFDGIKVRGMPTHTIVRGKVVYEEGEFKAEAGYGRFVPGLAYNNSKRSS